MFFISRVYIFVVESICYFVIANYFIEYFLQTEEGVMQTIMSENILKVILGDLNEDLEVIFFLLIWF